MDRILKCYILSLDQSVLPILSDWICATPGLELLGCSGITQEVISSLSSGRFKPDVIFVDVDDLAGQQRHQLTALGRDSLLVFYAADKQLAAEAFDAGAIDYLCKPLSHDRFLQSMTRIKTKIACSYQIKTAQGTPYFYIQSEIKGKLIRIVKEDIMHVESTLNYLQIHLDKKIYSTYLTISEMEDKLQPPQFMRVHKSFMINLEKVVSVEANRIYLTNGIAIPLGPSYRKGLLDQINTLLIRSKRLD